MKLPTTASKNGFGNAERPLQLETSSSVGTFASHLMARVQDCGRTPVAITEDTLPARSLAFGRPSVYPSSLWKHS